MATMSKLIAKLLQLEWADPDKRKVIFKTLEETHDGEPLTFDIVKISETKSRGGDSSNSVILWGEEVD